MLEQDAPLRIARFACRRCGWCCKGDGVVRIEGGDTPRIARLLGLTPKEFVEQYTIKSEWDGRFLVDKFAGEEQWCVFLECDASGAYSCRIQDAKPSQCSSFPYTWRAREAFEHCEGLKE